MDSYWKAMKSYFLLLKYSLDMLLIQSLYDNRSFGLILTHNPEIIWADFHPLEGVENSYVSKCKFKKL